MDDDEDLRAVMADLISLLGHECVAAASLAEVVTRREEALSVSVAIVDINLGPDAPSGLDVYRWLRRQSFAGAIVFLTGHGRGHPLVAEVCRVGEARVIEKPIGAEQLASLLAEAAAP